MVPLFCCLFLMLGQSLASRSGDQYFDTVIDSVLPSVLTSEKLDPTFLPDLTFEYEDRTILGKVHGKVKYSEGTLHGLSRVKRQTGCDGPTNGTLGTVIGCTLVFESLEARHKGKVKYGVLPKVSINAKADLHRVQVGIQVARDHQGSTRASTFFVNTGDVKPGFSGLGPLNKQMGILERNYSDQVRPEVEKIVINRFRYAFELAAAKVPVPQS